MELELAASTGESSGWAGSLPRSRHARPAFVGGRSGRGATAARLPARGNASHARRSARDAGPRRQPGHARPRRRDRVRRPARVAPGDRLRRINWRATALRADALGQRAAPGAEHRFVLFLDTFAEARADERNADRAVRAAATLAHTYLQRKDRVGLVGFGGSCRGWAGTGTRQLYASSRRCSPARSCKATPCTASRATAPDPPAKGARDRDHPLFDEPHRGRAARPARPRLRPDRVEVSPLDLASPEPGSSLELAHRLWRLSREALRCVTPRPTCRRDVARRGAPRGTARGGERIQAPRQARVALAAGAVVAYGRVVVHALVRAPAPAVGLAAGPRARSIALPRRAGLRRARPRALALSRRRGVRRRRRSPGVAPTRAHRSLPYCSSSPAN